jgi:NAD(P)H-flavin reductase
MDIKAPRVAKSCRPGQFVIVRLNDKSERIPLTICDYNSEQGTVTIVFQRLGVSTSKIFRYEVGDTLLDFAGPLGQPFNLMNEDLAILNKKKVVFVTEGIGAAHIYPQIKWLYEQDIKVDVIVGGKSKEYLLFENEITNLTDNLYVATEDGSCGYKGTVVELLKELIGNERKEYNYVSTVGPMTMMKHVCDFTKGIGIKTTVSLKQIMIDGIGICGGCRVSVGDETKFACIDGPEFDGHLVNFDEAINRQSIYKKEENHKCHIGLKENI